MKQPCAHAKHVPTGRGNVKGEARCVHFHGPKPDRCLPCYLNVARLNPVRAGDLRCMAHFCWPCVCGGETSHSTVTKNKQWQPMEGMRADCILTLISDSA